MAEQPNAYLPAVADLLAATLRTLDAGHPVQYGIKELPNGRTATWHHPEIPDDVTERYNRCPTCEQWSPCDVRKAAEAAALSAPSGENISARELAEHVMSRWLSETDVSAPSVTEDSDD